MVDEAMDERDTMKEELPPIVWVPLVIVSLAALVVLHRHAFAVWLGFRRSPDA